MIVSEVMEVIIEVALEGSKEEMISMDEVTILEGHHLLVGEIIEDKVIKIEIEGVAMIEVERTKIPIIEEDEKTIYP